MVDGRIMGQPIEPGGKARLPPEAGQGPPRGQEGILGYIPGVLLAAAHPQRQMVDPFFVLSDQLLKGDVVAPLGRPYQFLFSHADPS